MTTSDIVGGFVFLAMVFVLGKLFGFGKVIAFILAGTILIPILLFIAKGGWIIGIVAGIVLLGALTLAFRRGGWLDDHATFGSGRPYTPEEIEKIKDKNTRKNRTYKKNLSMGKEK